jgi:DNA polymerase I-like protein with 3'-5' exonuclease and polymerase domains/uracil-DNA glycosylase
MKGFVPDRLVEGSRLLVLNQSPGKEDEKGQRITGYDGKIPLYETVTPQPLIGATGYQLANTYLPLAGETFEGVSTASLLKCRYKHSNTLPPGDVLRDAVSHCTTHHLSVPSSVQLIVALGGPPFEFTQPELVKQHRKTKKGVTKEGEREKGGPINSWRGFLGPETYEGRKVFAVVHPADLFRDAAQRIPARLDWKRIGRVLRGEWPKPIPSRLTVSSNVEALNAAFDDAEKAEYVAIDTEFNPETKFLSLIGLGWPVHGERTEVRTVTGLQLRWVGDDSIGSEVRACFIRRLARLVRQVPIVLQNAKADLSVISKNLHIAPKSYRQIEDTMHMHSVLWSEMPHSLDFLASIYGGYTKLKHLQYVDELLYNWGDVIETIEVYEALRREFKADPLTEKVYREQSLPLIPITLERETLGIRINQTRRDELVNAYTERVTRFAAMAECYAGYPLNLVSSGCNGQLASHLRTYEGLDLDSVDEETIATERDKFLPFERETEDKHGFTPEYVQGRINEGAHPLLELRAAFIYYSQALNQDLLPLKGKVRVYPSFRPDAQASGRWSTTRPALAKVPNDFLSIYVPDEGKILFGADYDAQEPRIFMAEAKSTYLKRSFDDALDIHTMLVCDMFGWPHPPNLTNPHNTPECEAWRNQVGWGGKEDKRRTVSKNVRYERYYMGTGKQAIKKAVKLGLPKEAMERASRLVIQQDPNVADFHRGIKKLAKTKRVRSWFGRLRVCLGTGEQVEREMCNHKMQAGGVDILNLGLIEVAQKYPFASMFYTRHDSFWFEIPESLFTEEVANGIRQICEQPRPINGMMVKFPGSWKTMTSDGVMKSYKFTKEVSK